MCVRPRLLLVFSSVARPLHQRDSHSHVPTPNRNATNRLLLRSHSLPAPATQLVAAEMPPARLHYKNALDAEHLYLTDVVLLCKTEKQQ